MEKRQIISFIEYLIILIFLFTIGSGIVVSPIFGDVNVIDEGQFAAWVTHMLSGEYLYKDIYAAYGPLYIYPIYILAKIFSPSVFLIRVVLIVIYTFLAVIIVKYLLQALKIPYHLRLFCFILLLLIPGFGMRQGIGLLSILLTYKAVEKKNLTWSLIAGISLASAFLVSSEIGIFSAFICGVFFIYQLVVTENIKYSLKKFFIYTLSYLTIFVLFFLWSFNEGWFFAYINSIITDLTIYSGIALPNGKNFPNIIELIPSSFSLVTWIKFIVSQQILLYWLYFFYFITFIYFTIRIVLRKMRKEEILVLLIAFYGFFLSMILIGRYGHFPFTLSPVFILFVYYLKQLLPIFKSKNLEKEKLFSGLLMLTIFLFSIRLVSIYRPHFSKILLLPKAVLAERTSINYLGPIAISQTQAENFRTMQAFIAKNTTKDDKIFFLNNEPVMYLLVNRDNPTRYDIPTVANILEKRFEVLNDLISKKPKYIIYNPDAWAIDQINNYQRLPEVSEYIEKNYSKSLYKRFVIYSRK